MGRAPRTDVTGGIYHTLNRGNARHDSFSNRWTLKHLNVLLQTDGLSKLLKINCYDG